MCRWSDRGFVFRFISLKHFINFTKSFGFGDKNFKILMRGFDQALSYVLTNQSGQIIHLNNSAIKLLGYQAEEVIGKQITDLCFDQNEIRDRVSADFVNAEESNVLLSGLFLGKALKKGRDDQDWIGFKKNGARFPLGTSVIAIFDDNKKVLSFLILFKDLTEKRKMDSFLEEQRARLAAASKFASLGEMAGGVAHEINNPLQIIIGKVEKLKREIERSPENKPVLLKELDKISATSERIAKIIRGMKTFSRNADNDPFDTTDIKTVIEDTMDFCAGRFRDNGGDLRIGTVPEILVECRATQISQVLLNLLNNAFDAIRSLPEKWVAIDAQVVNDSLVLLITDSGSGIPAAVADRLMEPFFTTKGAGSGTGLGLSISRGIIENHNGTFELNRKSPNTQFIITLPIRQSGRSALSA